MFSYRGTGNLPCLCLDLGGMDLALAKGLCSLGRCLATVSARVGLEARGTAA